MPALRRAAGALARALALCAGLAAAFAPAGASAHRTNLATARVEAASAEVRYSLSVSAHDLAVAVGIPTDLIAPVPRAAFAERAAAIGAYFADRVSLSADGAPCAGSEPRLDFAQLPDSVAVRIDFRCAAPPRRLRIAYGVFFDIDPGHRGIGALDFGDGPAQEFLLDRSAPEVELARAPQDAPWYRHFPRMLLLGIEHILAGADHVLFLVALLLVDARLVALVKVVTAFTLAHSLTLSLAWFGAIDLPVRLVESLIALSIAYVAVENLLGHGARHRWLVAFGFGLVHGLGFFGVLRELDLARGDALTTLLGFNLGVEVGQLAVVSAAWPLLAWAARLDWYGRVMAAGSAAILALAGFWFVERAFLA